MRTRQAAAATAVSAVLGIAGCSAEAAVHPAGAPGTEAASARTSPSAGLRGGLLTQDRLPPGFELLSGKVNSTTTDAPRHRASTTLAGMPCSELGVHSFMTAYAPPAEDVSVGLERDPGDDLDDEGWFGQEVLDRYAPGQAAALMAGIRDAAQRCASYTDTLTDGTRTRETASVTGGEVPADDGLVLHLSSTFPDGTVFVGARAFVRIGDVILTVQEVAHEKPSPDLETVLAAAVTGYRASAAR